VPAKQSGADTAPTAPGTWDKGGTYQEQSYSNLLNNQRDAALSSRIYSPLQGYSTCFGCFLHPSSGVQLKLQMQS
jgi:hypothetical protein